MKCINISQSNNVKLPGTFLYFISLIFLTGKQSKENNIYVDDLEDDDEDEDEIAPPDEKRQKT